MATLAGRRSLLGDELRRVLGCPAGDSRVLSDPVDLQAYAYDASFVARLHSHMPDAVVSATSTEEVARVLRFAHEQGIPVMTRGAGTAQTGGSLAVQGGIMLSLSRWKTVEEVDAQNLQVFVRPGIVHADLNKHLRPFGVFFPPDPGSSRMATVGGMVANNSSGLRAVKYGVTSQYVLGLEVVLADGTVIVTGGMQSRALKTASGVELTKLFVGSEGTFGVITLIRLKVLPIPKARNIILAVFPQLEQTVETVWEIFGEGILPSAVEIMDRAAIQAANKVSPGLDMPEGDAILLFEVDGNPPGVDWEGARVTEISRRRATLVERATDEQRMAKLWEGRSVVGASVARLRRGFTRVFAGEDISVPISRIAEAFRGVQAISEKYGIQVVTYGHIGDGNVHTGPLIEITDPEQVEKVCHMADEIHELALRLSGSVSAEHGTGLVRVPFMRQEHGPALDTMLAIKRALDPKGILNPGKIWPDALPCRD